MTDKTLIASIVSGFNERRATIAAKSCSMGNVVLMFEDGIRFIGGTAKNPQITGFEHAIHFGDRRAAYEWLNKIGGIADGKQEKPGIHLAFNAKQHALAALDKVIANVSEMAAL